MISTRPLLRRLAHGLAGLALSASLLGAVTTPIPVAAVANPREVTFRKDILPLLQANCLPCHNQTRAKAGLNLETPELMRKGGDSGSALVPGKPAESLLLRTAAHQVEDLVMPPAGNKSNARDLTPEELGLLSLWIQQGGRPDGDGLAPPSWRPISPDWQSSFAVAVSADGRTAAVGRANRIELHDVATGRRIARLVDPSLDGVAQRDLVGALAFSPDDSLIAAAGFREVRLWRRQPAVVTPLPLVQTNGTPRVAAFCPDRTRVAWVTDRGIVEIRAASPVGPAFSRPLPAGTLPSSARLAWSPDSRWLAVAAGTGSVQVLSADSDAAGPAREVGVAVRDLAWWEGGLRLALVLEGTNGLRLLRRGAGDPPVLDDSPPLPGSNASFTAIASGVGPGQPLVAARADGMLLAWNPGTNAAPAELAAGGPVFRLDAVGAGPRFVVALSGGGAALATFGGKPSLAGPFVTDPSHRGLQTNALFELERSRLELALAGTRKSEGEAGRKAAEEALVKVREKREGHAKALAELERELAGQRGIETNATKERDDATAQLEQAQRAFEEAETARKEAVQIARREIEAEALLRIQAASAERLRTELDRLATSLPAGDTNLGAVRIREAAAAAGPREAVQKPATGTNGPASLSVATLDERAFAAGRRKAELDRAQAELPPRKKQAEDRRAAAAKRGGELDGQITRARTTLDGSSQDLALAEKGVVNATAAVAAAAKEEETARGRIQAAESGLAAANAAAKEAATRVAISAAGIPDGSAVLLLDAEGHAVRQDPADLSVVTPVHFGRRSPLAVAAADVDRFLVLFPDGLVRLETRRPWVLERTLGNGDPGRSTNAFIDRVNAVAFSPDGRHLATGGGDPSRSGELKLWKVADGTLVRDYGPVHSDCVTAVAFSPRGEWLATGGADRFARITPVEGEGVRLALEGHTHHVMGVGWSADGSMLATGGAEGVVKLWNPRTGERRKNVDGFVKEVAGIQAAGLAAQFVAVGADGRGRLLRTDGEKVRDLTAVPEYVQALAVARDGTRAFGTDDRGILSIWNLATGEVRREVPAPASEAGP